MSPSELTYYISRTSDNKYCVAIYRKSEIICESVVNDMTEVSNVILDAEAQEDTK